MQQFEFKETKIKGMFEISPFCADDERGYFSKVFEKNIFLEHGINFDVIESMCSYSKKGVVRGLHFQVVEPQAKLISVPFGEIFDVGVDLRPDSETFGKWYGAILSNENKKMLYIPRNFAHGYIVLSDEAYVTYQCDNRYYKEYDGGIYFADKDIDVKWPTNDNLIVSEKDKNLMSFTEYKNKYIKN